MGYDYRWVIKPTEDETGLSEARKRFHAAIAARDEIPREEAGSWAPQLGPEEFTGGTERWRAAQAEIMRASDAVDRANISYFRLNIWGGGRYCRAMMSLGMVRNCAEPGEWPKAPELDGDVQFWDVAGMVEDCLDADAKTVPADPPPDLPDYYTDEWVWLSAHPEFLVTLREHNARKVEHQSAAPDAESMWAHKIAGSNDGWINTPDEIRAALKIYDELDPFFTVETLKEHGVEDMDYWDRWLKFLHNAAERGGGFQTH